jgi:hypothetical protein
MAKNKNIVLELISDSILCSMELDLPLPDEFTINLPDEALDLLKTGLVSTDTNLPLPKETKAVFISIQGKKVTVRADSAYDLYNPPGESIVH